MGRKNCKYDINLSMPTSDEELKNLRKKILKALEKLMKEQIRSLAMSDKEKKSYYDDIMKNILSFKELDQK
ncbi:MAG TPA: hypothetical protein GX498_00235 [Clostridiales bacterium]|nr:hypothetical protein [Clostridiales bacterium]